MVVNSKSSLLVLLLLSMACNPSSVEFFDNKDHNLVFYTSDGKLAVPETENFPFKGWKTFFLSDGK